MPWNPDTYNRFKGERSAPFLDLMALVDVRPDLRVIDLGCGTGELTRKLADALPGAEVLGIDSSAEMLADAQAFANEHVRFEQRTIQEQVERDERFDVVISNAALQWLPDHRALIPRVLSLVKPGGQLVVQVPSQHHNRTNVLLDEVADRAPFNEALRGWTRETSVLDVDAYATLLFEHDCTAIVAYEKVYPLVLPDAEALYTWVSGTAMIPYVERLDERMRAAFIAAYKERLQASFPGSPVFYPFRRIVFAGRK